MPTAIAIDRAPRVLPALLVSVLVLMSGSIIWSHRHQRIVGHGHHLHGAKLVTDAEAERSYQAELTVKPGDVFATDWYGGFLTERGRFFEAEHLYLDSIEINKKARGKDSLFLAVPLEGLARSYERQRRYTEAEALLQECLRIRLKDTGKDSLDTYESMDYLGWLYRIQSRYSEAEPFFKECKRIDSKLQEVKRAPVAAARHNQF